MWNDNVTDLLPTRGAVNLSAFKLVLWADLAGYAVLMARWSGKALTAIMFPLALLLGTAVWPGIYTAFFFLGLGMLSWLRSGICFSKTPIRAGGRCL